jgi:NAD(P)-dependent dehydrogenase (short-subunit alcohol dehydrogenase family)
MTYHIRIRVICTGSHDKGVSRRMGAEVAGPGALVTGAARGIGRAIAVGLARHGFAVVCAGRSMREGESPLPGSLHATADQITRAGGAAYPVRFDMLAEGQVPALLAAAGRWLGSRLTLLVHAAMSREAPGFAELDATAWRRTVSANLDATFLLARLCAEHMTGTGGSIVLLTSAMADPGQELPPGYAGYAVTKAATERMVSALAPDLARVGVAINALRPGATRTEYAESELGAGHDWAGWRAPESVLPAVLYLAAQRGHGATGTVVRAADYDHD